MTTIKPSGTLSLLAGATPGVHPAYNKYYIRRVRMASDDKLVPVCKELGYKVDYVKNFDGNKDSLGWDAHNANWLALDWWNLCLNAYFTVAPVEQIYPY